MDCVVRTPRVGGLICVRCWAAPVVLGGCCCIQIKLLSIYEERYQTFACNKQYDFST